MMRMYGSALQFAVLVVFVGLNLIQPFKVNSQVVGDTKKIDYCITPAEAEMLTLVNTLRKGLNLVELKPSTALGAAAREHSLAMRDLTWTDTRGREQVGFFDHVNPDGSSLKNRVTAQGYYNDFIGENIAWGNPKPKDTFEQWRTSSAHYNNMVNTTYRAIGIGYAPGPGPDNGTPRDLWTQDFGGAIKDEDIAKLCGTQPTPTTAPTNTPAPTSTPAATQIPPVTPPVTVTPTNVPATVVPTVIPNETPITESDLICTGKISNGKVRITCVTAPTE